MSGFVPSGVFQSASIGSFLSNSWSNTPTFLICDSKNIEAYIQKDYAKYQPQTTYIAYGTDTSKSILNKEDEKVRTWFADKSKLLKGTTTLLWDALCRKTTMRP